MCFSYKEVLKKITMPINKTGTIANMKGNTKHWGRKFLSAPAELKAFAIFIVVATVAFVVITFVIKGETLTSYRKIFGASLANGYMFSIYFIFALINFNKNTKPEGLRFAIASLLIFTTVFNCWMLFFLRSKTVVGSVELIWNVLIPIFWVLLLFSPRVNRFCESIIAAK
jgi:hypothetical protein